MKIVQNYKENIFKSASDSTYIFLLKIKILFAGFCTPSPQYTPVKPSTLQYIEVPCTLKHSVYPVKIIIGRLPGKIILNGLLAFYLSDPTCKDENA